MPTGCAPTGAFPPTGTTSPAVVRHLRPKKSRSGDGTPPSRKRGDDDPGSSMRHRGHASARDGRDGTGTTGGYGSCTTGVEGVSGATSLSATSKSRYARIRSRAPTDVPVGSYHTLGQPDPRNHHRGCTTKAGRAHASRPGSAARPPPCTAALRPPGWLAVARAPPSTGRACSCPQRRPVRRRHRVPFRRPRGARPPSTRARRRVASGRRQGSLHHSYSIWCAVARASSSPLLAPNEVQAHVDPGGDPRRRHDRALVHPPHLSPDRDRWEPPLELVDVLPVARGLPTLQDTGGREEEGAGADGSGERRRCRDVGEPGDEALVALSAPGEAARDDEDVEGGMVGHGCRGHQAEPAAGLDGAVGGPDGVYSEGRARPTAAQRDPRCGGEHLERPAAVEHLDAVVEEDAYFGHVPGSRPRCCSRLQRRRSAPMAQPSNGYAGAFGRDRTVRSAPDPRTVRSPWVGESGDEACPLPSTLPGAGATPTGRRPAYGRGRCNGIVPIAGSSCCSSRPSPSPAPRAPSPRR